ncbi:hypothetical protein [Streptomyces sp. NPDC025273]|uniref:hypothetical protein n=1 Tax=unclassified Streptomyces TaxID=2593676 RepID=UPI0033C2D5D4
MSNARVTFLGVRHHSPACAGLVRRTIRELRPAYVLVEGPADMSDRIGELLLLQLRDLLDVGFYPENGPPQVAVITVGALPQ